MRILDTMLGRESPGESCKFSGDRYDVTFTVSTDSHDVAYAIPVRKTDLDALETLVRVERDTPYVEDGNESLSSALESVLDADAVDAETWVERMAAPRRNVEPLVETWRELLSDGESDAPESAGGDGPDDNSNREFDDGSDHSVGNGSDHDAGDGSDHGAGDELGAHIVYVPVGMEAVIASFVQLCRRRAERQSDPFAFPEEAAPVAPLLARINTMTDRPQNRVVVNRRYLPA